MDPGYNRFLVGILLVLVGAALPLVCAVNELEALVLFAVSAASVVVGVKVKFWAGAKLAEPSRAQARAIRAEEFKAVPNRE